MNEILPASNLNQLSSLINESHCKATSAASTALEHARRTGELLIEAKSQIEHGGWLQWLKHNCDVSPRQAQRYIKVCENWESISTKNDATSYLTIDDAIAEPKPHVSHNSGENEWYTPQPFVESARVVLKSIDLDPASSEVANRTVRAEKIHSLDDDGLSKKWNGRVWLNPPYASNLIGAFAEKLVDHVSDGSVPTAIVLVNNATETKWFQTLLSRANAVCFPSSRIRFLDPEGNLGAPLQGQALVYFGDEVQSFRSEFSKFGFCLDVPPSIENTPGE